MKKILAVMLSVAALVSASSAAMAASYTDVPENAWYTGYVNKISELKGFAGYEDNTFKPDNPITRAEAVKIINSVLDRNDYRNEKNPFGDVSQNHWAYKQILEAAIEHTK